MMLSMNDGAPTGFAVEDHLQSAILLEKVKRGRMLLNRPSDFQRRRA
jgi:hypothetical protein